MQGNSHDADRRMSGAPRQRRGVMQGADGWAG